MDSPETCAALVLLVEPVVDMVVSTTMGRDQIMGTIYVLTITASIEVMKLEALPLAVDCQEATVVELREEDLVEGHP